jgi:hypothetical protein
MTRLAISLPSDTVKDILRILDIIISSNLCREREKERERERKREREI